MTQNLIKKAKEIINDYDVIIDVENQTYTAVSGNFCKLVDYECVNFLEKPFDETTEVIGGDRKEILQEIVENKRQSPVELVVNKKDGSRIKIIGYGKVIEHEGKQYVVGKITDLAKV
ncbi:hypothetical protein C0583_04365 [Candidatus Parcubacteria bacterium]|nr:MAG: hypothetical protein C0583_04365 [Candidatus Parcubacteria bacterium]